MKKQFRRGVVCLFVVIAACIGLSAYSQNQEKTAEQVYKNIQTLKGVPAGQVQQAMALFTGSLGVKCNYCHTNPFDKDDKPTKQTARRMIQMVFDLNRGNFGGRNAITCYSCHRGQPKPDTVVALGKNLWLTPEPTATTPDASMPTVDQILDRYTKAVGGKELLAKMTSRISRGSRIGADGVLVPEEVYQRAPNKLMVTTRYPQNALMAGFDGQHAWTGDKDKGNELGGDEAAEMEREATFDKEVSLKGLYTSMNTAGKATVGDREAYVIEAVSKSGNSEKLYFDVQTGLLIRRYRESKTVLGPFPQRTDYDDYQVVDGIKLPLTIRWSMPGRSWGRRIAEVKHNVAIGDESFNVPGSKP